MEDPNSTQQPSEELLSSNTTAQKTVGASAGENITAHRDLYIYTNAQPASSQVPTAAKSPFRCKMPTRAPHYKGRAEIEDEILKYFKEQSDKPTHSLGQVVAIVGPGGIGKSETACQFAKNYREFFPNAAWINAETEKSTLDSFLSLAKLLEIVLETTKEADVDLVQKVYRCIDAHYEEKVLLIFDNAVKLHSDGSDFGIFDYLPTEDLPNQRFPFVIITSNTPDWQKGLETFRLNELTEEESIEVFRSTFNVSTSQCDEDFKKLHFHLEGYPLAMSIATSRIKFNPLWYKADELIKQIELCIERLEKEEIAILTTNQIPLTVRQLFQRLEKEPNGVSAITLLQAASFFNNP